MYRVWSRKLVISWVILRVGVICNEDRGEGKLKFFLDKRSFMFGGVFVSVLFLESSRTFVGFKGFSCFLGEE